MIIREWRGRASRSRDAEYPAHFRTIVVPELRNIPGFLGATLSKHDNGERVEFVVLTRWKSMDAVRAFAGTDHNRAVVEPGAIAALSDYDHTVRHYELIENVVAEATRIPTAPALDPSSLSWLPISLETSERKSRD